MAGRSILLLLAACALSALACAHAACTPSDVVVTKGVPASGLEAWLAQQKAADSVPVFVSLYSGPKGEELANTIAVERPGADWSVELKVPAASWSASSVPAGRCISWMSAFTDSSDVGYLTYMTEECGDMKQDVGSTRSRQGLSNETGVLRTYAAYGRERPSACVDSKT
jgi:hypothetical protein